MVGVLVLSSAASLLRGQYVLVALLWTVGFPLVFVSRLGMRVTATNAGIRIVNWWRPRQISWKGVDGFDTVSRGLDRVAAVRLRDGGILRISATAGTRSGGASRRQREHVLAQLELMRDRSLGTADSEEGLAAALAAAERGDPEPLDHLLATHKISGAEYTEQLHVLARTGQADVEALRRERRNNLD